MSTASRPLNTVRQEAWALLRLGGPVIAAQLAGVSMNFVDTVMAGHLSPQDLAAVAVGGSLWMPLVVFCMGTLMSVTPTVAHAFGARNHRDAGRSVRQALWISLGLGIAAIVLTRNAAPVLHRLEVDAAIIPTTTEYLAAISWGLPGFCAYVVLRCFSEGVSVTRPIMWISLLGLAVHIAANYVFMYGYLGVPALGAVGCGWASALVMWLMLFCLAGYIAFHRYYEPFGLCDRFELPDWKEIRGLLKLGVPIGTSCFMEGSLFATVALLMGTMGAHTVAGHQVAINVASLTFMVPLGISMAITVRVGQALGSGNLPQARRSGSVGMLLAVGFMSLTALTMATLPHQIAGLYTKDAEVHAVAVSLLGMAAIFQISDGLQVSSAGALRGLKDTRVPMAITLVAYWGLGLPLGYTLGISRGLGPRAMWIGLIAGLTVAGVLLNLRFHRVTRRLARLDVPCEADADAMFVEADPA